ncbi:glycosyltransferase family 2 protein [Flavobacterium sp. JAS]|uniref:glycosyltransferase family 2 protein n=1 Tax=Flavobacterium sp. JAS TaxID=2897329 RepID=UPI001E2C6CB3|nr:glycosyltransferase family 2 protein [Flavobacterium sp. JAS]MCD0471084.1 glycosyltransferase [Flavobacterium sp. JAS]
MSSSVSIIIPSYNRAEYLNDALQSVLDQTHTNWECIIVDDGSSDNTKELVEKWIVKDGRFKYVYKKNGGASSARNAGLHLAKGEFIQFLDSDDFMSKFKIEKQLTYFNEMIDIVICDFFPFDQQTGSFLSSRYRNPFPDVSNYIRDIIINWEIDLSIPCHCVLFKSKLLHQNRFIDFDESLVNHEDWVFWVQLFYYSSGIYNLQESLVSYRIHNKSLCADNEKMKEYFLQANKNIQSFFENIGDKEALQFCSDKLKILKPKKEFNLKKTIKLFIPPILLIIKKRLVKNLK